MRDKRRKIYEIVEPEQKTWWEANRHKVMFVVGCLLMYLLLQACDNALSTGPQTRPAAHTATAGT
ncbi:hypothetical protein CP973_25450 [Streptomyces albofaciens JCM 4342]|uniref:hypothetical protein n=1 Tax=Streptomyces albofaciens TaxID=66866 RepID=UPI00123C2965|nr:hypothetical protein [Streptomyces albofaciens]KAA6212702.1 hypothetical protein CP973_25450 [Streptomyces albofaciens JCM 4342]